MNSKLEVVPITFADWCAGEQGVSKKKSKNRQKELSEGYGIFCTEYRGSTEFGKQLLEARYG